MARSRFLAAAPAESLVLAGVLGLQAVGWLQSPEPAVYDQFMRSQTRRPQPESSHVVLLQVTEPNIRDQGHWPLSDRALAEALRALADPATSKPVALQRAQARLLTSSRFSQPFHWSPYQLLSNWL